MGEPIDDFYRNEERAERKMSIFPVCKDCGYRITDEKAYVFYGEYYCEKCVEHEHRIFIDLEDDE